MTASVDKGMQVKAIKISEAERERINRLVGICRRREFFTTAIHTRRFPAKAKKSTRESDVDSKITCHFGNEDSCEDSREDSRVEALVVRFIVERCSFPNVLPPSG
jgi:hypothetical protein